MIRIRCPKCRRQINLDDFRAGHVGRCLQCRQKFRVPGVRLDGRGQATQDYRALANAPPLAQELFPHESSKARPRAFNPGSSAQMELVEEEEEKRPAPVKKRIPQEPAEVVAEEAPDEEERPRPIKRKRKKKQRQSVTAAQVLIPVLFAAGAWVLLVCIAFLYRPAIYALWIVGFLAIFVGRSMFLRIAGKDGYGTYLACLFVPFYSTYYFFKRINLTLMPFLIGCCGFAFVLSGGVLAFIHNVRDVGAQVQADGQARPAEKASLVLDVNGKKVSLPLEEMNYFHVKRGRDQFPDSFEFSGNGISIRGTFDLGFEEDWEKLVGKPVTILPKHDEPEEGDSEITLPGRGMVKVTGGSFTVQRVITPRPEAVLQGIIVLECEGGQRIQGTFQVPVHGWY
jgi:hypothetical protein